MLNSKLLNIYIPFNKNSNLIIETTGGFYEMKHIRFNKIEFILSEEYEIFEDKRLYDVICNVYTDGIEDFFLKLKNGFFIVFGFTTFYDVDNFGEGFFFSNDLVEEEDDVPLYEINEEGCMSNIPIQKKIVYESA